MRPHGVIPPPFQPFLNKLPPSPPPVRPSVPPLRHFLYASQENNFSPFHPFLLFSLSLPPPPSLSSELRCGKIGSREEMEKGSARSFLFLLLLSWERWGGRRGRPPR